MSRPVLAIAFGPRSIPVLDLVGAVAGRYALVWLVDSRQPAVAGVERLLRRTGAVVDAKDRSFDQIVEATAAERPEGLTTFYDTDMVGLARLAEALGLPFHSPEVALRLTDKGAQRAALAAAGVAGPRSWPVPAGTLPVITPEMRFPLIAKPRVGSGSWHTFRAGDEAELLSLWSSVDGMAGEDMVIEEYIPDGWPGARSEFADYVSVESVVVDGTVTHLATNGRFALAPPFRECGFFIPSQLDAPDVEAVLETAGRAIEALDVRTGCIHTEVKLTGDGPRLLEVNGRVGGGVPFMLREATGVDILDLAIDVALGRPIAHHGLLPCTRVGYRVLVQPPPGRSRVGPVHGLDELARQPGVEGIDIHHPAGDLVDSRHGSRAYVFGVSGTATDHAGMLAVRRFIGDEVHIDYQDA